MLDPLYFLIPPTPEISCEIVDWMESLHNIDDALGICAGMSSFCLKHPYHIHNFPGLISSATGLDMDEAELKKIVRRSRNLHRAVNVRRGLRRSESRLKIIGRKDSRSRRKNSWIWSQLQKH
jgi:aldehyde:ferredoxin oxidoreductase